MSFDAQLYRKYDLYFSSLGVAVSIVLGVVLVMVLLLAKQIITLYHAVQKTLTKDQHALVINLSLQCVYLHFNRLTICFYVGSCKKIKFGKLVYKLYLMKTYN